MLLAKPPPYAGVINSPLSADGSNFPCQLQFDDSTTPATSIALGSVQPLDFTGSATHGGGSCQISITYDDPPTKNSVFKVIQSIEGGCPTKNNAGNIGDDASSPDPDTYSFTMPTNLPTGKAVLAWTWFNKIGNREMYMNCAPIDITAGSSKRSEEEDNLVRDISQLMERDQAAYNALPNMFTANILNIGSDSCKTTEGVDILFPNPGSSIAKPGLQANLGPPVGCGAAVSQAAAASAAPATSTAGAPGVFATTAPANSAVATTMATSVIATSATSAAPAASASASPASSSGATGAMTAGSACTPEGLWNCIGGTSFQQCASGTWSVVQSLAAGTQCTPGQSSAIDITASKRGIRFSSEHVRRHLRRSS
jgi:hypothetical protein